MVPLTSSYFGSSSALSGTTHPRCDAQALDRGLGFGGRGLGSGLAGGLAHRLGRRRAVGFWLRRLLRRSLFRGLRGAAALLLPGRRAIARPFTAGSGFSDFSKPRSESADPSGSVPVAPRRE